MATIPVDDHSFTVVCDGIAVTKPQVDALLDGGRTLTQSPDETITARLTEIAVEMWKLTPDDLTVTVARHPQTRGLPHVTATIRRK